MSVENQNRNIEVMVYGCIFNLYCTISSDTCWNSGGILVGATGRGYR